MNIRTFYLSSKLYITLRPLSLKTIHFYGFSPLDTPMHRASSSWIASPVHRIKKFKDTLLRSTQVVD